MFRVKSLFLDVLFIFLIYKGVMLNDPNWGAVLMGCMTGMSFIVTFAVYTDMKAPIKKPSAVYELYNTLYNLLVFILFLYFGWYFFAVLWVWLIACAHWIVKHSE